MDPIRFNFALFNPAGVLEDPTSIRLEDPTASYGIRRLDTNQTVIAAGSTAGIVHDATGRYHYLYDPIAVEGVEFEIVWRADPIDPTGPIYLAEVQLSGVTTATGSYHDQNDIANMIGADNLQIASDLENDDLNVDIARVQLAISTTEAEANRRLRAMRIFQVPLAAMDDDTAFLIRDACAHRSAWWLYQNRGIRDIDPDRAPVGVAGLFENHRKLFDDFFDAIRFDPHSITATRNIAGRQPRAIGVWRARSWRGPVVDRGLPIIPG